MKTQILLLSIFCVLTIGSCTSSKIDGFAIYLLSQDISVSEVSQTKLDQLPLAKTPLISSEDIISYERINHSIQLTPAAYKRFQQVYPTPIKVNGIPFVVCVGPQRIYTGALWSPASSISYDGVIILQSFGSGEISIQLKLGYPRPEIFTGSDPRSDPRIIRALEHDAKLKSMP